MPRSGKPAALALAVLAALWAGAGRALAVCVPVEHEQNAYIVCELDQKRHRIALFLDDPNGEAFGGLSALDRHLRATGQRPLFLMNAGMYHADLSPVGLYVEEGRERRRLSTGGGPGNFHLRPNGVLFVAGGRVSVLETREYQRRKPAAEFATQSGPMLVINGRLHPRFSDDSDSLKVRNGVGVAGERVVFALSREGVTFAAFARLFRDRLRTPNALFLDGGSVPSLLSPAHTSLSFRSLGPIVGAFER
jgi:uncharacterized protein YigE (DUF2233 family)